MLPQLIAARGLIGIAFNALLWGGIVAAVLIAVGVLTL